VNVNIARTLCLKTLLQILFHFYFCLNKGLDLEKRKQYFEKNEITLLEDYIDECAFGCPEDEGLAFLRQPRADLHI